MGRDRKASVSKFIALILRHQPDAIGISLDEHGWADVEELIAGINAAGRHLDRELLEEIVRIDEKQRYRFNEDHSRIRANQGHSISVDVELKEALPPEILWHGTGEKSRDAIEKEGLKPMGRLYVHLSADRQTARKVGSRHGRPVIFRVNAEQMAKEGFHFYLSENHVWLTKEVPVRYLKTEI